MSAAVKPPPVVRVAVRRTLPHREAAYVTLLRRMFADTEPWLMRGLAKDIRR
jgi:hypothetical protein